MTQWYTWYFSDADAMVGMVLLVLYLRPMVL